MKGMNKGTEPWVVMIVLAILLLAATLRLRQLADSPGWYSDEGSNVAIAAALARGEPGYLAFGDSYFITGHMPLVLHEMAVLFRLLGVRILWARALTATLGLLTVLILFLISDRISGRAVALCAAGFYAVYPGAVALSRMAFTYNQLAPLVLAALYALWRAGEAGRSNRWILLAAGSVAAALVTDLAALGLFVFFVLAVAFLRPRALLWAVPLALVPLLAWGTGAAVAAGPAFLDDVRFTLRRLSPSIPQQVVRILFSRTALEGDLWLALGGAGLLLIRDRRGRRIAAGFFWFALFVLARNSPLYGQASYYLIPLFPLAAWGVGEMAVKGLPRLLEGIEQTVKAGFGYLRVPARLQRVGATVVTASTLFLIVGAPLVSMAAEGIWMDYDLYLSRFGGTLANPQAARAAAAHVNAHTGSEEVVLASPTIAWLIEAKTADFQMAVAATGEATQHFPAGIPRDRFRFDPRLEKAVYVVLDPLWRGWAAGQMDEVGAMVNEVEAAWQLERSFGEFDIYRNPASRESSEE